MIKIRKLLLVFAAVIFLLSAAACSSNREGMASAKGNLKIVTTFFPAYDWAKNILGDNISKTDLTLLCDKGIDIHSYQPSVDDIITISNCDIFIYIGGESESWVDDALKSAKNKKMTVINLMSLLGDSVKEEEIVEGMQAEEEEEEEGEGEEPEYDEHVWLSIRNTKLFCTAISNAIYLQRTAFGDTCKKNLDEYLEKLDELDNSYNEMIQNSKFKTLIFGDRFPFRYFVDDYALTYYAAFVGCSAESEASFDTISFLADKLNETGVNAILTLESSDDKLAKTIIETGKRTDVSIIKLDSMQTITQQQISDGADFLNIMQSNLESIKKALN